MNDFANLRGPTSIDWAGQGYGTANYSKQANVIFYQRPTKDEKASKEANRPIFVNVDHIVIQHPGETSTKIDRPASNEDKHRYRDNWSRYLANKEQVPEGTPIDLLFVNNPAMAENLKAYGVWTVEQCANMSASAITNIGIGGQDFANKAKAFLESASQGANFLKLERDLKDRDTQIRLLQTNYDNLKAQFTALMQKLGNPGQASETPAWQPGHDAQIERLNANHPTAEVAKKRNKGKYTPGEGTRNDEVEDKDSNAAY